MLQSRQIATHEICCSKKEQEIRLVDSVARLRFCCDYSAILHFKSRCNREKLPLAKHCRSKRRRSFIWETALCFAIWRDCSVYLSNRGKSQGVKFVTQKKVQEIPLGDSVARLRFCCDRIVILCFKSRGKSRRAKIVTQKGAGNFFWGGRRQRCVLQFGVIAA